MVFSAQWLLVAMLYQPGEQVLRRAVELTPTDASAHSRYAIFLQQQGRLTEAVPHFRSAFDLAPRSTEHAYNLALALLHDGQAKDALAVLDKQASRQADALALRGAVLNALERPAEAAAALRASVAADPNNADTLYDLVLTLLKADGSAEASKLLDSARRRFPRVAKIYAASGMVAYLLGRDAEAVKWYETAVQLEPDGADLYLALGDVHDATGNLGRAEQAYRRSLQLDPASATAHVKLGKNQAKLQRPAEAQREFAEAVRLDPAQADAHFQLGKLASARGDHAAAVEHHRAAVEASPGLKEAWYQLGISAKRAGDEAQSAAALEQFRRLP
jgi:tetratricopeptide (TPR) repeat protein